MPILLMPLTLVVYFLILWLIARRSSRCGGQTNDAFFRAGRQSPWWMVAFGMIGASISGVTFVSVPGWAEHSAMTYLQMCLGFIVGYVIVALVLLPLYYKLGLTSIYAYLGRRFGPNTRRTGSLFFLLSKLTGGAARLFLVCSIITTFVMEPLTGKGFVPFAITACMVLLLIWGYTRQSGIQTIVRTDALQTLCLLLAGVGITVAAAQKMGLDANGVIHTITSSPMSRVFEWDWTSRQAFWRQFLSGVFIVIVMTGLDQDMMQKNLTCRNLREAQKNMCVYGLAFLPVNALFLGLGILLSTLCASQQPAMPSGDALLPAMVSSGVLGAWVVVPFTIGIVAAAFSSADSALTALTTTACIDLLRIEERQLPAQQARRVRRRVHALMVFLFLLCMVAFRLADNNNVLNAIYVMASYTYGPLLGLYAFGLYTRQRVTDRPVPYVCLAAPIVCAALDYAAPRLWGYTFGYELLLLNGLLTFGGLWLLRSRERSIV